MFRKCFEVIEEIFCQFFKKKHFLKFLAVFVFPDESCHVILRIAYLPQVVPGLYNELCSLYQIYSLTINHSNFSKSDLDDLVIWYKILRVQFYGTVEVHKSCEDKSVPVIEFVWISFDRPQDLFSLK